MNKAILFTLSLVVFCLLIGCPHRKPTEIDVDQIQDYVDQIDKHLKGMYKALREKKLDDANDKYEEALDIFEDQGEALSAYPEIDLLKSRLDEAKSELCYGSVNANISRFFEYIRKKDAGEARSKLDDVEDDFERCNKLVKRRDDFMAIKMNVESCATALADLEKEIRMAALREKMQSYKKEIAEKKSAIGQRLKELAKASKPKTLADKIRGEIETLKINVGGRNDFSELSEWPAYVAKIHKELSTLEKKVQDILEKKKKQKKVSKPKAKKAKKPKPSAKKAKAKPKKSKKSKKSKSKKRGRIKRW
jgi:hypothetical protein